MKNQPYSFPIILTLFRLVIVPPFFIFLLPSANDNLTQFLLFCLFVSAALTDFLDGYLARRWKQVSLLGSLLDPFADKVFITSVIMPLVALQRMPLAIAFCIIVRELWVTSLRESAGLLGKRIEVQSIGKIKTCVQLVYIGCLLVTPFLLDNFYISWVNSLLMAATIIVTLYSGYQYTKQYYLFISSRA
jgi:CDP-diacylglycerol--glycerol-3-phosphate 3-phosphatidyltransferase